MLSTKGHVGVKKWICRRKKRIVCGCIESWNFCNENNELKENKKRVTGGNRREGHKKRRLKTVSKIRCVRLSGGMSHKIGTGTNRL